MLHYLYAIVQGKATVDFKELLMSQVFQLDAVTQLLIKKGIITKEEFFIELKHLRHDYESKKGGKGS